jgi:hypothetical protein
MPIETPFRNSTPSTDPAPAARKKRPPGWLRLDEPSVRRLKVYALDPSAGNYVGNVMTVSIRWERDMQPGPIGRRIAVVDYDAANKCYYPPVDLDDYRVLARDGLDPSESDPRFHQQMVYAVAMETVEKFEVALGRRIHWRRADRPPREKEKDEGKYQAEGDIWVLKLYPHAMIQANAFYSREAEGILFGYFRADDDNPGNNLPGQRVFTCLSHDIIAHEVTHAVIDGIRQYFTEPTNPDVLAFHEAFADLTALFLHFSHKEALLDTIQKTGGRLYQFELRPDAAPPTRSDDDGDGADPKGRKKAKKAADISAQLSRRNPLIDLAQQFGEASGMNKGLRQALTRPIDPQDMQRRVNEPHYRGSILVAAVFDAYFSVYIRRTAKLFQVFHAGGGEVQPDRLPGSLADLLAEQASRTAAEFFQLCARAIDYCPPVDVTFGDFLRALMTVSRDLNSEDPSGVRDALMQAFRVRGIYPESASFFSEDALCWPLLPHIGEDGAFPPVEAEILDPLTKLERVTPLAFGSPGGLTRAEKDLNGDILRAFALKNADLLGFDASPGLPARLQPYPATFHSVFRVDARGRLRTEMVVELVQTRHVPFDPAMPEAGTFPMRAGVTLIIAAPEVSPFGQAGKARVRFAIAKKLTGPEGASREARQRKFSFDAGLNAGNIEDPHHFEADFALLHQGL